MESTLFEKKLRVPERRQNGNAFDRIAHRPPRWLRWTIYVLLVGGFLLAPRLSWLRIFFPLAFAIPILTAAWWDGRWFAYALAALSMAPSFGSRPPVEVALRLVATILLVELVSQTSRLARRVRILEGLLPICCVCHQIRDENQRWHRLEYYMHERADVLFTHGFCPDCFKTEKAKIGERRKRRY
jgi:hypothetical protein